MHQPGNSPDHPSHPPATPDQVTFLNGRYGQPANVLHDEDRPRTSGEGEGFIRRPGQQNWEPLTPDNRP